MLSLSLNSSVRKHRARIVQFHSLRFVKLQPMRQGFVAVAPMHLAQSWNCVRRLDIPRVSMQTTWCTEDTHGGAVCLFPKPIIVARGMGASRPDFSRIRRDTPKKCKGLDRLISCYIVLYISTYLVFYTIQIAYPDRKAYTNDRTPSRH